MLPPMVLLLCPRPSVLIRDLGITYDCNLRFNDYIEGIVKKAFMRTNLLFRAFVSGNVLILTRAYLTYIRPIVEYCTHIWSPHQAYLIDQWRSQEFPKGDI